MSGNVTSWNILAATWLPRNVSLAKSTAKAANPNPHVETSANGQNESSNLPGIDIGGDKVLDIHGFVEVLISISPVGRVEIPVGINDNAATFIVVALHDARDEITNTILLAGLVVALVGIGSVGIEILVALGSVHVQGFANFADTIVVVIVILIVLVGIVLRSGEEKGMVKG